MLRSILHSRARERSSAPALGRERRLTVRPLKLTFSEDTPRHWMGGDAWETHLLNALSLIFPGGERFFMRSVRALRDHVTDPKLLEQVKSFLAQEALHSREHANLNLWLTELGIPADVIESGVEKGIIRRSSRRSPINNLALTCALEHFTAVLAKLMLTDETFRARFHPSMLPLWYWHAIEELDHKAVAFDVYHAAKGGYPRRVAWMMFATMGLPSLALLTQSYLLASERRRPDLKAWASGVARYLGPRGHLRKVLPDYLSYYRRDFHPWQHDDRALIAQAERELLKMLEQRDAVS